MKYNYDIEKAQKNAQKKKLDKNRIYAYILLAFFLFWSIGSVFGILSYFTHKEDESFFIGASADGYEIVDEDITRIQYGLNPLNPANFDFSWTDSNGNPYISAVLQDDGGFLLSGGALGGTDWQTVYTYTRPNFDMSDERQATILSSWRLDFFSWYQPAGDTFPYIVRLVFNFGDGAEPYIMEATAQNNITMLPPISVWSSFEIQIATISIFDAQPWYPNLVYSEYFGQAFRPYIPIVNDDGSYDAGYIDGYNRGYDIGENEGYSNGYDSGYHYGEIDGYNTGYSEGQRDGDTIGYNRGYDEGYTAGEVVGYGNGFQDGIEDANDYSFYGLLTAVVDAPVKAFTGLFNFEILGVNMLDLFTGLFTLCVVLAVVKWVL